MVDFQHGDPIKVSRPNRKEHGWLGRYVEAGQDPAFAWVALAEKEKDRHTVRPDPAKLLRQDKCPRKLLPLSSILPDDN